MKTILLIICVSLMSAVRAYGGIATFTGEGKMESFPELISLTVTVTSECFDSARIASEDNDLVAIEVMKILEKYYNKESKSDGIFTKGGYVQRYTGRDPETHQPICVQKFKKINEITLKSSLVNEFPDLFSEMQDTIYGLSLDRPEKIGSPVSFIEIAMPQVGLSYETKKVLEKQALALAVQDAIAKAEVAFKERSIVNYMITKYSESFRFFPDYSREHSSAGDTSPVRFDNLQVISSVTIEFSF